jgi:hypothetical protein
MVVAATVATGSMLLLVSLLVFVRIGWLSLSRIQ